MKEILVGFISMGITVLGVYVCCKYEKIGNFFLYGTKALLLVSATYLLGAVILGTI